jgi:hypothetical protein
MQGSDSLCAVVPQAQSQALTMSFVPNGYLSIQEALNRLGRELFPSEWTGEEHKARREFNQ